MQWCEAIVSVLQAVADDAGGALVEAGALGVQIVDAATGSTLIVSYGADADAQSTVAQVVAALASVGVQVAPDAVAFARREDQDWAVAWKEFFKPLPLGERFWVVPSWEEEFVLPEGSLVLHLDPGMAFGTGQHATTALCVRALEDELMAVDAARLAHETVLDLGCGSGILAIAAAKLGCQQVYGVDNDPIAVDAARDNVARNGVADRVAIGAEDISQAPLPQRFHRIVANILATTLIELAPTLLAHLERDGWLLLSGILAEQKDDVCAAYEAAAQRLGRDGWRLETVRHEGEWVALAFRG